MLWASIGRWRERGGPAVVGLVLGSAYLAIWRVAGLRFPERTSELISAAVTVSSISIGFIATALSILAANGTSAYLAKMREQNSYDHVLHRLRDAVYFSVLLLLLSLLALLIPHPVRAAGAPVQPAPLGAAVGVALWIASFGAALASYLFVVSRMTRALEEPPHVPTPDPPVTSPD